MWIIDGEANNSPVFPWVTIGQPFAFTMTLVNDSDADWANTYLFVPSSHLGRLTARAISGENASTSYNALGVLGDSSFYLGRLNTGDSVTIDFILTSLSSDVGTGIFYLPLYVGHDAGAMGAYRLFFPEYDRLFSDCYAQTPLFQDTWTSQNNECPLAAIPDGGWSDELTPIWSDELTPIWNET
jgi:hypothetical protein